MELRAIKIQLSEGENSFNWELKVAHKMIFGNLGNFVALEKLLFCKLKLCING